IPMELNAPLLVGGLVAWFVASRSKDKAVNDARRERGTLIASGLIAGGALFGVFAALTRFFAGELTIGMDASLNMWLGIVMYVAIVVYLLWDTMRAKPVE
ncbi:MAG: OPT/YSL family transporter, partial [Paramuribaculum sp.]|nr:OPT/YSL family transporter [Paramuribaculum sp.]